MHHKRNTTPRALRTIPTRTAGSMICRLPLDSVREFQSCTIIINNNISIGTCRLQYREVIRSMEVPMRFWQRWHQRGCFSVLARGFRGENSAPSPPKTTPRRSCNLSPAPPSHLHTLPPPPPPPLLFQFPHYHYFTEIWKKVGEWEGWGGGGGGGIYMANPTAGEISA